MAYSNRYRQTELDEVCNNLGISHGDLARELNVTRQTIYRWGKEDQLTPHMREKIERIQFNRHLKDLENSVLNMPEEYRDKIIFSLSLLAGRMKEYTSKLSADQLCTGLNKILPLD